MKENEGVLAIQTNTELSLDIVKLSIAQGNNNPIVQGKW